MSKNIIVCLDGTGNQPGGNMSNVAKLYRMVEREEGRQIAYYDPGVGTMGDPTYKSWTARKVNKVLGLAFGRGLTKNIIEAYTYLMEQYEEGDNVFLFGFSRGAYTARALAAFIKECGLFEKGAQNLIPYAIGLFLKEAPAARKKDAREEFFKTLSSFRSTYGRRFTEEGKTSWQLRIQFVGLFDTVKSYGWVTNPVVLRNELQNPSILTLRHALAIDERRVMFRQMHWTKSATQDCKEVWFPGVHSDVGGGYPEDESGLGKVTLEWMVEEACAKGLLVDWNRYELALGEFRNKKYPGPDPTAEAHESLKRAWWAVQLFYKRSRTIESERERDKEQDHPTPLLMHQSVKDRLAARKDYKPPNFPTEEYDVVEISSTVLGVKFERFEKILNDEKLAPYLIQFESQPDAAVEASLGKLIGYLSGDRKRAILKEIGVDGKYNFRPYTPNAWIGIAKKENRGEYFKNFQEDFDKLVEKPGKLLERNEVRPEPKYAKLNFTECDLAELSKFGYGTPNFREPWDRRRALVSMVLAFRKMLGGGINWDELARVEDLPKLNEDNSHA